MSYSPNSLKGGYIGDYIGFPLQGLLKGILGVQTIAHMTGGNKEGALSGGHVESGQLTAPDASISRPRERQRSTELSPRVQVPRNSNYGTGFGQVYAY